MSARGTFSDMLDEDQADNVLHEVVSIAHALYRTVVYYTNGSMAEYPHRDLIDARAAARLHVEADRRWHEKMDELWGRLNEGSERPPSVMPWIEAVAIERCPVAWDFVEYAYESDDADD